MFMTQLLCRPGLVVIEDILNLPAIGRSTGFLRNRSQGIRKGVCSSCCDDSLPWRIVLQAFGPQSDFQIRVVVHMARILLIAGSYFATGRIGLHLAIPPGYPR